MKRTNTSGPGAAHTGLFGRQLALRAPEDDDTGGAALPASRAELQALLDNARTGGMRAGRAAAERAATEKATAATQASEVETLRATVGALTERVEAMARPAPPSAPSAPTRPVNPTTHHGLVDLFNLQMHELDQLGPEGVREHLDKAIDVGRRQAGIMRRPTPPAPKGGR